MSEFDLLLLHTELIEYIQYNKSVLNLTIGDLTLDSAVNTDVVPELLDVRNLFDVVVVNNILHNCYDLFTAVGNISKSCKLKGKVVMCSPAGVGNYRFYTENGKVYFKNSKDFTFEFIFDNLEIERVFIKNQLGQNWLYWIASKI